MPINQILVKRTVPIGHSVGNFLLLGMNKSSAKQPVGDRQQTLLTWLDENDVDMKEVSVGWLRRNPAYIHQYIFRGSPQFLPEAERRIISQRTGLSEDALGRKPITDMGSHIPSEHVAIMQRRPLQPLPIQIPIYGLVEGGDGQVLTNWDVIDYADCPSELKGVKDAFGMYVVGESMEPAFMRGDRVFVNPHKAVKPGDDVLVFKDRIGLETAGLIKRMVKVAADMLIVEQFNPPKKLNLSRAEWRECYVVVTRSAR